MANNTVVGTLTIVTEIATEGLRKGIAQAEISLDKFGKAANDNVRHHMHGLAGELGAVGDGMIALGPIGIAAGAAMATFGLAMEEAKKSMEFADTLADSAIKLHMNVEALQQWRFAATEAGLKAGDFDTAIVGLQGSVGKLLTNVGAARVKKAFDALGISKEQIASFKSVDELLPLISEKLLTVGTVAQRVALAEKLGFAEILPLLELGPQKMLEFRHEALALGIVIDTDTVAKMHKLSLETERAASVIDINLKQAFMGMAPIIASFTSYLADVARELSNVLSLFSAAENRSTAQIEARQKVLADMIKLKKDSNVIWAPFLKENEAEFAKNDAILAKRKITAAADARAEKAAADALAKFNSQAPGSFTDKAKALKTPKRGPWATESTIDGTAVDLTGHNWLPPQTEKVPELKRPFDDIQKAWDDKQEAIRAAFATSIRGGLEAGMRGGIPGVMEYIAQQLRNRLLDNLANGLANMFSGAQGGWFGKIASIFAKVPGFANGTSYAPGGVALVGERGPELVNLPRGSGVMNASDTAAMGRSQPIIFDMRGAVVTADLLAQMNAIGAQAAVIGAQGGAAMARQNMSRSAWNRMA